MDPVTAVAQYGFPAIIAVIIFVAYQKQNVQLMDVIRNNTEAMSRVGNTVEVSCDDLARHDLRAANIEVVTTRIDGTTIRVEQKLDRLAERMDSNKRQQQ